METQNSIILTEETHVNESTQVLQIITETTHGLLNNLLSYDDDEWYPDSSI